MKLSDGLFLTSARHVAEAYPDIEFKEMIADNACMQLVMGSGTVRHSASANLYGDLLSDLAAGWWAAWDWSPAATWARTPGLFEAVHGTAPTSPAKDLPIPPLCC